ncbi:MAG: rRNA maturation RNase YbeY [Pseudomonadota bacterium]
MTIEVLIEAPAWEALNLPHVASRAAEAAFSHLGVSGLSAACLATDDARISVLNTEFRGKPKPTNVLSWPTESLAPARPGAVPPSPKDPEIGDIALAFETCAAEAKAAGIALSDHVTHLVIHGILHLLGYDHEIDADADLMEKTEIAILLSLGIANPYA